MSGGGRDWRSLYERERERAEAAEARDAPALQREVERLRREGALEKALAARGAEVRSLRRVCGEADAALRKALRVSRRRKETIGELRRDRARSAGR